MYVYHDCELVFNKTDIEVMTLLIAFDTHIATMDKLRYFILNHTFGRFTLQYF